MRHSLTVTFGRSRKDLLLHCFCMATSFSIISCCCGSSVATSWGGVGVTTVDVRAVSSSCCFFIFFSLICSSESTPTGQTGCTSWLKLNPSVNRIHFILVAANLHAKMQWNLDFLYLWFIWHTDTHTAPACPPPDTCAGGTAGTCGACTCPFRSGHCSCRSTGHF